MQNVSCPSCGAQVSFRSHASVMAVCEYCKTSVLKNADTVKNYGKMSDVLEDYSPVQIGTSGVFGGRGFTVIGRIQLRYSAGMWNEWYLLFDDGAAAWLGDSSGLFTLTTEKTDASSDKAQLPAFADITPGQTYPIAWRDYLASEVRIADCIGGQGELPFKVGQGWQAKVADFRHGTGFLTLDYSDSEVPTVYIGQAVTLAELKCQLLRDDDTIKDTAGKFRGKIDRLGCPSCGGNINYLPGLTATLICPSCHSQLDTTGPTAQVLATATSLANLNTTLELGAQATINGVSHQIIGLMKRSDDENTVWTEYLLYSARTGFLWLVETDEGWARSKVQDEWPSWSHGETATIGKTVFKKLYDYQAKVIFAAGAFNWRVNVGDVVMVTEFESGQNKLAAEMTTEEITWSQSTPVPADQIRAWFGEQINADKAGAAADPKSLSRKFIFWILALNAIPLLMNFSGSFLIVGLAIAAIYYPAKFLGPAGKGDE